jgi:hypothetical protein
MGRTRMARMAQPSRTLKPKTVSVGQMGTMIQRWVGKALVIDGQIELERGRMPHFLVLPARVQ